MARWLAPFIVLAVAGCGNGGRTGAPKQATAAATAAASAPSAATPTTAPTAAAGTAPTGFTVSAFSPRSAAAAMTPALVMTFTKAVDPATVSLGRTLVVYEDADTNYGGTYYEIQGTVSFDAAGTTMRFTPTLPFRIHHEVRILLARRVKARTGESLERSPVSSSISFAQRLPDAVFEGRFSPQAGTSTTGTPQAALATPVALTEFAPEAGTDVWHIDFDLRAVDFARDMGRVGLASGDAATDTLARDRIVSRALGYTSQKYRRTHGGDAVSGRSWRISFTPRKPAGTVGWHYSREAVGGRDATSPGTLGRSLMDPGNRRREDNSRAGDLGIFSNVIDGSRSFLYPALRASDRRYLDGTYRLGQGTASEDARFLNVLQAIDDWGHALSCVIAHEVGHSVGLDHVEGDPSEIMNSALSSLLLSTKSARFGSASAPKLDQNLGRAP